MARSVVTPGQLSKLVGVAEVQKEIARRLSGNPLLGKKLKNLFLFAAQPIVAHAKRNISVLPVGQSAKSVLTGQVVAGRGPAKHPNAFVAMYQWAVNVAARKSAGGRVPNPAWFEYGTVERITRSGHRTGKMTATPFFRPAITQGRPEVKTRLVAGLKDVLVEGK